MFRRFHFLRTGVNVFRCILEGLEGENKPTKELQRRMKRVFLREFAATHGYSERKLTWENIGNRDTVGIILGKFNSE
tara:strand:+ start:352 stop:582 length:231 start_codon:yes stop_codon:yes gene_type:complete